MDIRGEVAGAEFGDRRLSGRLVSLAEMLARGPDLSFPKAAGSDAGLEATYRFLKNERVTPERILAPHYGATVQRCAGARGVVVCHDTTELRFSGPREGLGRIAAKDHGFLGHFALGVDAASRAPLGILGVQTIFRDHKPPEKRERRKPGVAHEAQRWAHLVDEAQGRLGAISAVHVMDREADGYEFFVHLVRKQHRFVARVQFDRDVETQGGREKISTAVASAEVLLTRDVTLSERRPAPRAPPSRSKKHPLRKVRLARLAVSARKVDLVRPAHLDSDLPATLTVHVVQVREVDAPEGAPPVEWRLITTELVGTPEEAAAVVDAYRFRWTIEEYFKALKTGCGYEKRQLEGRSALLNALALFAPIAWQLLALRSLARDAGDTPADVLLSPLKLRVLQGHKRTKLRLGATMREAMLAIAALGGHIKNNGDPGWIVLGRGFEDLLLLEHGAAIALGM